MASVGEELEARLDVLASIVRGAGEIRREFDRIRISRLPGRAQVKSLYRKVSETLLTKKSRKPVSFRDIFVGCSKNLYRPGNTGLDSERETRFPPCPSRFSSFHAGTCRRPSRIGLPSAVRG
jgi:hypothetical protein